MNGAGLDTVTRDYFVPAWVIPLAKSRTKGDANTKPSAGRKGDKPNKAGGKEPTVLLETAKSIVPFVFEWRRGAETKTSTISLTVHSLRLPKNLKASVGPKGEKAVAYLVRSRIEAQIVTPPVTKVPDPEKGKKKRPEVRPLAAHLHT